MSDDDRFGHEAWERRWTDALATHGDTMDDRAAHAVVRQIAGTLRPGTALDAGCGHGTEALCLAQAGWDVTAVDFSAAALEHAAARAVAGRVAGVEWAQRDLATWIPPAGAFGLVVSLYLHVPGVPVRELVVRLADAVAPGGSLLLVGHPPADPVTGEPSAAASQRQVTLDDARAVLDPTAWVLDTAEHRPRAHGSGTDAVIHAVRRHPAPAAA